MARLPYPNEEQLPAETRTLLERLPVRLNVFRMMAHAPTCFPGWLRLGTAILSDLELSPQLRELIILLVARELGCQYEWIQHVPLARAVGLDEEHVRAVEAGETASPAFDPRQQLLLQATREWLAGAKCSQETWQALQVHFRPREIVEAMIVTGFYAMLARVLESCEVDLDEPFAGLAEASRRAE